MKYKFFTEIYVDVPDRFDKNLVEALKYVDQNLRDSLHVSAAGYVDDSRLNVQEILIVDYDLAEELEDEN